MRDFYQLYTVTCSVFHPHSLTKRSHPHLQNSPSCPLAAWPCPLHSLSCPILLAFKYEEYLLRIKMHSFIHQLLVTIDISSNHLRWNHRPPHVPPCPHQRIVEISLSTSASPTLKVSYSKRNQFISMLFMVMKLTPLWDMEDSTMTILSTMSCASCRAISSTSTS